MVLLSPVLFPPVWGGGNETQAAAFCHLHLSLIPLLLPQGTRGEFPPRCPLPPLTLQQLPGGGWQGEARSRHAEVPHQHLHQRPRKPAVKGSAAESKQGHGDTQPLVSPLPLRNPTPTAKRGTKQPSSMGIPGTHLGSSASSMVGSILSSSVPAAAGLLGTALVYLCCPHAGSESRGQGPQGGFGVSFKFNQLWALIGEALVLAQPHKVPWPHGYRPGRSVCDMCHRACVSPELGMQGSACPPSGHPTGWAWVVIPWCLGALVPMCPPVGAQKEWGKIWCHIACHPGAALTTKPWEAWQMAERLSVLPGTLVALQAHGSR